jgi:membrane-anchored glycerophosphoryl diester phosphodiesterase (GDPDase)
MLLLFICLLLFYNICNHRLKRDISYKLYIASYLQNILTKTSILIKIISISAAVFIIACTDTSRVVIYPVSAQIGNNSSNAANSSNNATKNTMDLAMSELARIHLIAANLKAKRVLIRCIQKNVRSESGFLTVCVLNNLVHSAYVIKKFG